MLKPFPNSRPAVVLSRALALMALLTTALVVVPYAAPEATAMGTVSLEVWGISGGIDADAKDWKFRQSWTAGNDLGSAGAAATTVDDSAWETRELRWRELPGPNVANHFRKDFDLANYGYVPSQIEGIQVSLQYDDTAVLYLNGTEVYRSIRGNLPNFTQAPLGTNFPYDVDVPFGGAENFYVDIPNVNGTNTCEFSGSTCPTSPYGGPDTVAIDPSMLVAGTNTWSVTTWNQSGGGSGDSTLNHTFELLLDESVLSNTVSINEAMASNDTIAIPGDPGLGTPDWFELYNSDNSAVNIGGWTISDNSASWVFPPTAIVPANGYLVVAANDKDLTNATTLQTNFKLSSSGDTLKLTNADGFVADEYGVIPQQFADTSYGRPNDAGALSYLDTATPGQTNSVAGNDYAPVLRLFADRIHNQGEAVSEQVDAFDPDGDTLTYSLLNPPSGITIDSVTGLVTGTLTTATDPLNPHTSTVRVNDQDGQVAEQDMQWIVLPSITGPVPLVLNEYNAVADDRELLAGSVVGNGGDWFEFIVVEDQLDLRGYTIEIYDNKGSKDQLRLSSSVTFGNDPELARAPAGTIVTISEENVDDLNFDAASDWHINLQIDNTANGTFFASEAAGSVFNSTRSGQKVLIKDATGAVVTPVSGETDAWDSANGGVSGGEVMNLCVDVAVGFPLDPVTAYRDNGSVSSFGLANTCVYTDPNDPASTITFNQDLSALRASATLGAGSGDANCDLNLNVGDALAAAQFSVGNRVDSGPCFFDLGGPGFDMYAAGSDINNDGRISVADALIIARCSVSIPLEWCPEE